MAPRLRHWKLTLPDASEIDNAAQPPPLHFEPARLGGVPRTSQVTKTVTKTLDE